MIGVDFGIFLSFGLPIRSLKYNGGGSSNVWTGLGINSAEQNGQVTVYNIYIVIKFYSYSQKTQTIQACHPQIPYFDNLI